MEHPGLVGSPHPLAPPAPALRQHPGLVGSPRLGQGRRILTVSELSRLVRGILEQPFRIGVWVEGELSNVRRAGSGHLYFTLKDEDASVQAVMWRKSFVRAVRPGDRLRTRLARGELLSEVAGVEVEPTLDSRLSTLECRLSTRREAT